MGFVDKIDRSDYGYRTQILNAYFLLLDVNVTAASYFSPLVPRTTALIIAALVPVTAARAILEGAL